MSDDKGTLSVTSKNRLASILEDEIKRDIENDLWWKRMWSQIRTIASIFISIIALTSIIVSSLLSYFFDNIDPSSEDFLTVIYRLKILSIVSSICIFLGILFHYIFKSSSTNESNYIKKINAISKKHDLGIELQNIDIPEDDNTEANPH